LEGRKSAVKSLNPDLAFATGRDATPMNVEIKTQMSPKDVFTDLLIVKCHNDLENRRAYRAAFLWILLEPEEKKFQERFRRSTANTQRAAKFRFGLNLPLHPIGENTGISFSLVAP
jgi:hypothetical protein